VQDFRAIIIKTATKILGRRYKRITKKGLTILNDYIALLLMKRRKYF